MGLRDRRASLCKGKGIEKNMAIFTTLYSGSSGNCAVVKTNEKGYLLIDMGKSCRITLNALKEMGLSVRDCQGILVTHEHFRYDLSKL